MKNQDLIKFLKVVGKLKRLKRSGWIKNNIPDPESVAEHSFRVAIFAMLLASEAKVDQLKIIKMALVHDIGEAEVGDIILSDGNNILYDPKLKFESESAAFNEIFSTIDGKEYIELYKEYEENKTPEAKFVKQLDKLEMGIQALEYEENYGVGLESFFVNTRGHMSDDYMKSILNYVESLRKK